ncbi:unnamed protein product [Auanema sp. JU1783]|nr:unnamed protein product [Auanema sp. JU1783]
MHRLSLKKDPNKEVMNKLHDFLSSSIWALPIATFIEQKSIVFDRSHGDAAFNEYRLVHTLYRELVNTLLECFCGDSNIPLEKLQEALLGCQKDKMTVKQRTNLEPLAAASDFDVFVPMMMRKNVELQLQALQMIEFLCGLIPTVLQIEEGETLKDKKVLSPEETERYVLISVMRQSKEEFDKQYGKELREDLERVARDGEEQRLRLTQEKEKEELLVEKAMAENQVAIVSSRMDVCIIHFIVLWIPHEMNKIAERKMAMASDPSNASRRSSKSVERPLTTNSRKSSAPSRSRKPEPEKTSVERPESVSRKTSRETPKSLKDIRRPSLPARPRTNNQKSEEGDGPEFGPRRRNVNDVHAKLQESERLNTADVEGRRQYLQQQRDKLLTLKNAERQKQIEVVSAKVQQERPRTAKAARGAMRGNQNNDEVLAQRRALASKLKAEIAEI